MTLKPVLTTAFFAFSLIATAKSYSISSPDGKIELDVTVNNRISYAINLEGSPLLTDGEIAYL